MTLISIFVLTAKKLRTLKKKKPRFVYLKFLFTYFCLRWIFALCGLSLVAVSGDCSLDAVHGLLIAAASLVAEASGHHSCGAQA